MSAGTPSTVAALLLPAEATAAIRFIPNADVASGSGLMMYLAWDQTTGSAGGTGDVTISGGTTAFSSGTNGTSVGITPINDAPVLTAGTVANLTVAEDSGFTSLGLNRVTYGPGSGVDEASQTLLYAVTSIPGSSIGDVYLADGTTKVTIGPYSLRQIQGMQFQPANNATGTTGFQFNVYDSGGTAFGGSDNVSRFMLITVTSVNDAPIVTMTSPSLSYTENGAATAFDAALTVSDSDSANLTGAAVTISGNYANGQDILGFTNQLGITGSWSASSGVLTLSGTTTKAHSQTALRSVTYFNSSVNPSELTRMISVVVSDASLPSAATTRDTTVSAVNDPPTFTRNMLSIPEGGTVVLTTPFIDVTDADHSSTPLTFVVSSLTGGRFEYVAIPGTVISRFTCADIKGDQVQFVHDGGDLAPSYDLTVSDGTVTSARASMAIGTFSSVNDAPLISIIANQASNEDTVLGPLAFLVGDSETGAAVLTVTATSSNAGLIPNANIALGGSGANRTVTITPAVNQNGGPVTITLTVSDGLSSTQKTFEVVVTAVNDGPIIDPMGFTIAEDLVNGTAVGTVIATDVDAFEIQTFSIIGGDPLGAFSIDPSSGIFTVADRTQFDYETAPNWILTVQVRDGSGTTASAAVTVSLTDQNNNAPIITSQGGGDTASLAASENTTTITTTTATDVDKASTLTYSISGVDSGLFQVDP